MNDAPLTPAEREELNALRHFASEIAELLDAASYSQIHGVERIKLLYRSLDLSSCQVVVDPKCGQCLYRVRGENTETGEKKTLEILAYEQNDAEDIFIATAFPELGEDSQDFVQVDTCQYQGVYNAAGVLVNN